MRLLSLLFFTLLFVVSMTSAQPQPDTLWTRQWGGIWQDWPWAGIQMAPDNGYLLAGAFDWAENTQKGCLIRINENGDTLWTRSSLGKNITAFCQLTDGGIVLTADTVVSSQQNQDILIIRLNDSYRVMWQRIVGGSRKDQAKDIAELADGSLLVGGYTASFTSNGTNDCYLIKLNASGDTLWTRTWGGSSNDHLCRVEPLPSGGLICTGWTASQSAGRNDFYIAETDSAGFVSWERRYGTANDDVVQGFQRTTEGDYILIGNMSRVTNATYFIYVMRINALGDTLWTRTYGQEYTTAMGYDVEIADNGDLIFLGYVSQTPIADIVLLRTDGRGDPLWTHRFDLSGYQSGLSLIKTPDNGYVIAGVTDRPATPSITDIFALKTGPDRTTAIELHPQLIPRIFQLSAYPNPFNAAANIVFTLSRAWPMELTIYDVTGRVVQTFDDHRYGTGEHIIPFDGTMLPSGIYYARLSDGSLFQTLPMILLK